MGSDSTGEILGRHHCLERLGEGPLGTCYRARVYGIGQFVKEFSLTAVDVDLCKDAAFRERLVAAANRAAQLGGERLQHLYEVDQNHGRYYLVSELVSGVELGLLLELLRANNESLGVAAATLIALELAEALSGAHGRTELEPLGVLHLGLSPKTVVIDESGHTRVLHTGLYSSLVKPGWEPRRLPRAFVAPEVLTGGPATRTADVFSVGQILHELVGFLPEGERLRPIIKRATEPDSKRRYPSMMDLWAAIDPHCQRAVGRERLVALAKRYGIKAPPLERPTNVDRPLLPPVIDPKSDWAEIGSGEEEAATNVLDWEHPRSSVLSEPLDDLPSLGTGEISGEVVRLPPIAIDMRQMTTTAPPELPVLPSLPASIPAPPTLPLAALRPSATTGVRGILLLAIALVVLAALGVVVLMMVAARRSHGHANAQANVNANVSPDVTRQLQHPVAPTMPLLTVDVTPVPALVFVDGHDESAAPLQRRFEVGTHNVVVVAEGYALYRETVALNGDTRLAVVLKPARLPDEISGDAGLKVVCDTSGSFRVLVDGADTGRTCPNETRIEVSPGRHALSLYSPEGDKLIDAHKRPNVPLLGRSTRIYLPF